MFDSFAKHVGLNEVWRAQRSAHAVNTVFVNPQPGAKDIRRVGEEAAIMYIVDGEGCQWVPWCVFWKLNPSLPKRRLDVNPVLDRLSGQARLLRGYIREGVHDLRNDVRGGQRSSRHSQWQTVHPFH